MKFTSQHLPLGHEEGLCEAVYLQMAAKAGLNPPEWQLISAPKGSGAVAWLALKRFDYVPGDSKAQPGRLHMHSACGLLDADFRMPSLDYTDLIKLTRTLCKAPVTGELQFKRAVFSLFAANHDDHSKNWAFLMSDTGQWEPAPFFDVTFSLHPYGEHATSFGGYGKTPPVKAVQAMAERAGYDTWPKAKQAIEEVVEVLSQFYTLSSEFDIHQSTRAAIDRVLTQLRQDNRVLLARA